MCPPGYHRNGFVATHALGDMMYGQTVRLGKPYTMCPSACVATKPLW